MTQNKTAWKHQKPISGNLISATLLELLRYFARIFITWSEYSTGTFSAEHLFSDHLLLDTCIA